MIELTSYATFIPLLYIILVWMVALGFAIADGKVWRRVSKLQSSPAAEQPFSVIITAHDQLASLQEHLATVLDQNYNDYEVVVVDMASTDGTKEYLEQMELRHHNLRHTAVPASARDISLDRLALTLGIRAAKYDWVVITHANCEPISPLWLSKLNEAIAAKPDAELLLAHAHYTPSPRSWLHYKEDYYRLWHTLAAASHVLGGNSAVRADACNVAIRRQTFLNNGGFTAGQTLQAGAEELLANSISTPGNTVYVIAPEAAILEERPYNARLWRQQRLFYAETRRQQKHTLLYRLKQNLRIIQPWLMLLCVVLPCIACISLLSNLISLDWDNARIGEVLSPQVALWQQELEQEFGVSSFIYFMYGITLILFLMTCSYYIIRLLCFNLSARALWQHRFYITLFVCDILMPIWQFYTYISHAMTPRATFRKKFV